MTCFTPAASYALRLSRWFLHFSQRVLPCESENFVRKSSDTFVLDGRDKAKKEKSCIASHLLRPLLGEYTDSSAYRKSRKMQWSRQSPRPSHSYIGAIILLSRADPWLPRLSSVGLLWCSFDVVPHCCPTTSFPNTSDRKLSPPICISAASSLYQTHKKHQTDLPPSQASCFSRPRPLHPTSLRCFQDHASICSTTCQNTPASYP